jgi:hypothetical protein
MTTTPKEKVYLVWLHDDVLEVCSSYESAIKVVARTQGRFGGEWKRIENRWCHAAEELRAGRQRVSRLEIQMREVTP